MKMEFVGRYLFLFLAAIQILPWLFDVLENSYLLRKASSNREAEKKEYNSGSFRMFQLLVRAKFVIALTGGVAAVSGLFYFWLTGAFHKESLLYIGVIFGELVIFLWVEWERENKKTGRCVVAVTFHLQ